MYGEEERVTEEARYLVTNGEGSSRGGDGWVNALAHLSTEWTMGR